MPTTILTNEPTVFRSAPALGIDLKEGVKAVERDGGRFGGGIIRRFAVMTVGEALGHRLWCDHEMLQQACDQINSAQQGAKMRFNHPGASGDNFGTVTGRAFNATVEGDKVYADMHLLKSARKSPKGDLASYIMDLAEEDPASFGASIAFRRDEKMEESFAAAHSSGSEGFKSPDPRNTNHYRHARISRLRAVDIVDSPAANPDGLFHDEPLYNMLADGEEILDFVFGISEEKPDTDMLGVEPTRVKAFVSRHLNTRGLSLVKKETDMPDPQKDLGEKPAVEPVVAPAVPAPEPQLTEKKEQPVDPKAELKRYVEEFGAENGSKWYLEGKSFSAAQSEQIKLLKADNAVLKDRIEKSVASLGEKEPVSGTPADGAKDKAPEPSLESRRALGDNLAKFAANLRIPNMN